MCKTLQQDISHNTDYSRRLETASTAISSVQLLSRVPLFATP